jgi:hypothetical protein
MRYYYDGPLFKITSVCRGGGYRYCRTDPPHPKANAKGLYPLHRVLAENRLGRLLAVGEVVHHDDEDKTNDRIGNLKVETRSEHSRRHARKADLIALTCGACGTKFSLKPHQLRLRRKQRPKGALGCSRACGAKLRHHGVEQPGSSGAS